MEITKKFEKLLEKCTDGIEIVVSFVSEGKYSYDFSDEIVGQYDIEGNNIVLCFANAGEIRISSSPEDIIREDDNWIIKFTEKEYIIFSFVQNY